MDIGLEPRRGGLLRGGAGRRHRGPDGHPPGHLRRRGTFVVEARHGMPLHRLLGRLDLVDVPAAGDEAVDIDTWADLRDLLG